MYTLAPPDTCVELHIETGREERGGEEMEQQCVAGGDVSHFLTDN